MTERAIANSVEEAVRDHELSDDSVMELLTNVYRLCAHVHDNGPDLQVAMGAVFECKRPDVARAMKEVLVALGINASLISNSKNKAAIGEERVLNVSVPDVMFSKQAAMHFCSYARQHTPSFFNNQPRIGERWAQSKSRSLKRNFDEVYKKVNCDKNV